jgi:2-oxoglutarate dehydrogenase E2 component (dihydrolipoamide succinyltransferase)
MAEFKVLMPKMGESVQEATITKWFVKEGDKIKEDDLLFEIATEKVDSEIPSPVDGIVSKIHFEVGAIIPVGDVVALIQTDEEQNHSTETSKESKIEYSDIYQNDEIKRKTLYSSRFYSPLVRSIAKKENITVNELDSVIGSGANGRVQKSDILLYIEKKRSNSIQTSPSLSKPNSNQVPPKVTVSFSGEDQIIEMGRVRKLIADNMVHSVQISPHVTSVVEADVTNLVLWRNKIKDEFLQKKGEKLTFMPIFIEATARALREYPMVNSSVDGDKIILRNRVNVAIAVSKPDGNLIVPVIFDADKKNLIGLTSALNDLANRARNNKLTPDEIFGGTFSITNFGSFRNLIGTPIINQPQVAILATGSIEKKPAVMETPTGDAIVVRHKMFLSLSYDHRIVDGALGGAFLRRIADILEAFDINRKF